MRVSNRSGMTLVEVLAVVILLGLIAATLVVGFSGSFGKAKHELAKSGIGQIVQKLEIYRMEKGTWPAMDPGLAVLSDGHAKPTDAFYVDAGKLLDPWKRPYYLVVPGPDARPYEIVSYGSDGEPGGSGEAADLRSSNLGEAKG